jgi:uncharacterized protein
LPQTYSYPGVYIEEIPSGVRTIIGVPTSVVAFVGRANAGPTLEPTTIFSFEEFERQFGGLWPRSSLGYAVRDFYLNSPGGQAIIVRAEVSGGTTADAEASIPVPDLALVARSPGAWGNLLSATIDHDGLLSPDPVADKVFNLTITRKTADGEVVATEVYRGVSTSILDPRRVDAVLESTSKLVRLAAPLTASSARPAVTAAPVPAQDGSDSDGALSAADVSDGLDALAKADIFNLLCIPPLVPPSADDPGLPVALIDEAIGVAKERRAMLLLDPPTNWDEASDVLDATTGMTVLGSPSEYAAAFFPRIRKPDATIGDGKTEVDFAPCGAIAGAFARTDAERGVWKAPAGLEAVLRGAPKLSVNLSDNENGLLNPQGINCLRVKTGPARVIWGARTRVGADELASPWKYIPVRRLANFIEESLFRGTQWVVFEPNDEPLWASIRLNMGSFMHSLFRQGAFQGATPREAYFVKCDKSTTTQADIDRGIVNIVVGFAPLKPAEFVVIKLQQIAGSIES